MATKTLNVRFQQKYDTAENWANSSVKLLPGEMAIESDTGKFKFGDGENLYADLDYASAVEDNYYSITATSDDEDTVWLATILAPKKGDIAVVKRTFATDKVSMTAYMYNGSAWQALDGNYSADTVLTAKKITLAGNFDKIGNYSKGKEFEAGTSLQTILSGMFQTTIQPTKTSPSATITATGDDGGKETGDTYTKPTGTITVYTGKYTNEDTATGVEYLANNVVIAYGPDPEADKATYRNLNNSTLGNGGTVTMPATTYAKDDTTAYYTDNSVSYTFSGMAHNEAGNIAKDNLGENSNPVIQIGAGDLTVTDKTVSFRGYRRMFCGCTSAELNSATIRGLNLKNAKAAKGAFEVTAPVGATQIVLALPTKSVGKKYTMSKAEMYTSNWEDYTSLFSSAQTVQVADKRGGENGLQDYNVYTYNFAALKANTRFQFTVAEANA